MTRLYALIAAASIGFMGWQDYKGNSMFGRKAEGSGWFSGSPMRRGPDGRPIGGYRSYNQK